MTARWMNIEGATRTEGFVLYSVTRDVGTDGVVVYLAWDWATEPGTLLGRFESQEEARAKCHEIMMEKK